MKNYSGFFFPDAMLASQLNHLMEEIDPLCIVQADKFMCNRMQGDK